MEKDGELLIQCEADYWLYLGVLTRNKGFGIPLVLGIIMLSRVLPIAFCKQAIKKNSWIFLFT